MSCINSSSTRYGWVGEFGHTKDEEFPFPKSKLLEITEYCNTQYC